MPGPPSSRPSFPSSSGEPALRRLGVRGSSSEKPVRAQIIVALVVVLALVAVPLYLVRHPSPAKKSAPDAGTPSVAPSASVRPPELVDAGKPPERIRLGPAQRVRCGAGPRGGQEGNLCDQLTPLEESLAKTIRENPQCAPRLKETGTINYVLTLDFSRKNLHVFPGASGDHRGPQARKAAACIKRALPKPDWDAVRHQFKHYTLAILTTYLPESAVVNPTAPPKFE